MIQLSKDKRANKEINSILENFTQFFGKLSQEFKAKDSYEIYRDKATTAENFDEAIDYMNKSVSEAKKLISPKLYEELMGMLWFEKSARPLLKCKRQLAELYASNGGFNEAINEYFGILDLDICDYQRIRYDLVNLLLHEKRYEDFEDLIEQYDKDQSMFILYPRALYYFNKNDNVNAKRYIKKAFQSNIFLPKYLLGVKKVEGDSLEKVTTPEENDARVYFSNGYNVWANSKGALHWLSDELFLYASKKGISLGFSKEDVIYNLLN